MFDEEDSDRETFNIFRNGKVHVLKEECATCIFRPHTRPIPGSRVAEMVRETMSEDGSTVVCHSTLYHEDVDNSICRGWFDRLADRDPTLRLAQAIDIIEEDEVPEK